MITARMDNDKYVELSPVWEYEVVKYENSKIMLKGNPRKYPASDLQLLRDGVPITEEELIAEMMEEVRLAIMEKRKKKIVKILKVIGVSMLIIVISFIVSLVGHILSELFPKLSVVLSLGFIVFMALCLVE